MLQRVMSRFSVEICLSHSAKKFHREPFCVSLISGIERFYASESYVTVLCRNFFVSQAESFRRGIFSASLFSGIERC